MGFLTNVQLGIAYLLDSVPSNNQVQQNLATQTPEAVKRFLNYDLKAVSRTRLDIKRWNDALNLTNTEDPKNFALQLIMDDAMIDGHLTSQVENRENLLFTMNFTLKKENGEVDEEQTALLKKMPAYRQITREILNSKLFGYSMIELSLTKDLDNQTQLTVDTIPRTNFVPQSGKFYKDYSDDKFILYRELTEYGTWILEFDSKTRGLINKACPHVSLKRFTQSCWGELGEIYGIPPRVMKTDTQNPTLLNRAKKMMTDMGAAAWFIIDKNEQFEWAKGIETNGDVYNNLIKVCKEEISLLISGAVIGQDTKNGNRSKEEVSKELLGTLVLSDMALAQQYWNSVVLPAFFRLGLLKKGVSFEYDQVEDLDELWNRVKDTVDTYDYDIDWLNKKFSLQIIGKKEKAANTLNIGEGFFV